MNHDPLISIGQPVCDVFSGARCAMLTPHKTKILEQIVGPRHVLIKESVVGFRVAQVYIDHVLLQNEITL